jgi:hypothetical protein
MSRGPEDDTQRFNLGTILTRMRAVTDDDLAEVLEEQAEMENGDRLGIGELLVARGKLTGDQLEIALAAQVELRSPDKSTRAMAAARLATVSSARVIQIARSCRDSSARLVKRATGEGYPAVGAALKEG